MADSPSSTCTLHNSLIRPIVLNVSKKILSRESIFRQSQPDLTQEAVKPRKMTDSQVLNSQIYTRLAERMA